MNPAMSLMSGGLDSVAALAWALHAGYRVQGALSFVYGQRHTREIEAAAAIARHYNIPHEVLELPPIGGSPLTGDGEIPQGREPGAGDAFVAPTYVPNRNMIFIAYAAAHALRSDVAQLIGGWNAADAAGYPDCREEFLAAAQQTLRLATLRDFVILRPLVGDDKPAIVRRALQLGAPVDRTWTCYLGQERACGRCDACRLRLQAFRAVGVIDPLPYAVDLDWSGCRPWREAAL